MGKPFNHCSHRINLNKNEFVKQDIKTDGYFEEELKAISTGFETSKEQMTALISPVAEEITFVSSTNRITVNRNN